MIDMDPRIKYID